MKTKIDAHVELFLKSLNMVKTKIHVINSQ